MAVLAPSGDSFDENPAIWKSDHAEVTNQVTTRRFAPPIEIGVPPIERTERIAADLGGDRGIRRPGRPLDLSERSLSRREVHFRASADMPNDRDGRLAD
jgi:hypothetical protein